MPTIACCAPPAPSRRRNPSAARRPRERISAGAGRDPGSHSPATGPGGSHAQIDGDVLSLREAVEHSLQGELAADAALFVAAIGVAGRLPETLIDLHPAGLDGVRSPERPADVMRPHIGGKAVMGVVRHADRFRLVPPWNGD